MLELLTQISLPVHKPPTWMVSQCWQCYGMAMAKGTMAVLAFMDDAIVDGER